MPTPREITRAALSFRNPPRLPRHRWMLPWAATHHPEAVRRLDGRFPDDIVGAPAPYRPSAKRQGDPYALGDSTDDWGCVFHNIHEGIIGEVRQPVLADLDNRRAVEPPRETLPADRDAARAAVNAFCAGTDRFVLSGCCPRPWERYQFLRGSENAFCDIMDPDDRRVDELLERIHAFHMEEMRFWASTDVDALGFMDDWGSQKQLLIPPAIWRARFKPMYRDYIELARASGKFSFMHSDGHILAILPDLVELGLDALNSQLFCMDMADYARIVRGRLTLWGEIDRQHILTSDDPEDGRRAVREVAKYFYDPRGGLIAQCEMGLGANPEVVAAVFEEWERIGTEGATTKETA